MHHFQQGQVPELAQGQPPRDSDFKVHLQGDQGKGGGEGGKGRGEGGKGQGAGSQQLVLPGLPHCKTVTTAAPMQSDCTCFELLVIGSQCPLPHHRVNQPGRLPMFYSVHKSLRIHSVAQ